MGLTGSVFVMLLEYVADLDAVDAVLGDHIDWLDEHYRDGLFLASGRKQPRTGGIIFARGERAAVQRAADTDPFTLTGVARYTVVEFHPSRLGGALDNDAVREALG